MIPAVVVLAFQDQIALAVLGETGAGMPIGGLTIGLLLAYGAFFLMGFTLFAFVYAAVGSFVSRPDDLQTLSLPLSLLAMAGYVSALTVLLSGGGFLGRLASFVPPFSPFAMLARLMVSTVQPWEVALSVGILLVDDRGRGARDGPHLRDRRAALRPASWDPPVHRGRAARGLRPTPQVSSSSGRRLSIASTGAVADVAAGSSGASAISAAVIEPAAAGIRRHRRLRTPAR